MECDLTTFYFNFSRKSVSFQAFSDSYWRWFLSPALIVHYWPFQTTTECSRQGLPGNGMLFEHWLLNAITSLQPHSRHWYNEKFLKGLVPETPNAWTFHHKSKFSKTKLYDDLTGTRIYYSCTQKKQMTDHLASTTSRANPFISSLWCLLVTHASSNTKSNYVWSSC